MHPKLTFAEIKEREGALNFATDAWISPNHKVHVAVTVHFENKVDSLDMLNHLQ